MADAWGRDWWGEHGAGRSRGGAGPGGAQAEGRETAAPPYTHAQIDTHIITSVCVCVEGGREGGRSIPLETALCTH